MNCHETVTVNAKSVNWLKEKYPELCIKAGLCERIAGRLYTKTFTTPPAQPSPVQDPVADAATAAGLSASVGHLSALVDELRCLLGRAMANFTTLHNAASPDDGPDMDAIIPADVFAKFVNEDAALRYAIKQSAHDGMCTPLAAPVQEPWEPHDTAHRPGGLPQDFIKHEVENEGDWSEWVNPKPEQYFMKCCDCGLVHEMQFKVAKYSEGDECEFVADADLQAVFRARRTAPPAPVQEPKQCGLCGEAQPFKGTCDGGRNNPKALCHTPPAAQPAPVAFEVGLVEWVGNKLMATPKTTTTPPASWMEMVTANLVREGVNKHKARELAEHFYSLAQRQWVGLTLEEVLNLGAAIVDFEYAAAIEAKLKEKNT